MTLTDILMGIKNWILSKFIPAQTGYITTTEKGLISQTFIDLVTTAGAAFNPVSGYFELNGITDIPYDEMQRIYSFAIPPGITHLGAYMANVTDIRTCLPIFRNYFGIGNFTATRTFLNYAFVDSKIEIIALTPSDKDEIWMEGINQNCCHRCTSLRRVIGVINFTDRGTFFRDDSTLGCVNLEKVYLKSLRANIFFNQSSKLSNESILFMVKNSAATGNIAITLHADAYARAIADEAIQVALEAHPLVTLVSA